MGNESKMMMLAESLKKLVVVLKVSVVGSVKEWLVNMVDVEDSELLGI